MIRGTRGQSKIHNKNHDEYSVELRQQIEDQREKKHREKLEEEQDIIRHYKNYNFDSEIPDAQSNTTELDRLIKEREKQINSNFNNRNRHRLGKTNAHKDEMKRSSKGSSSESNRERRLRLKKEEKLKKENKFKDDPVAEAEKKWNRNSQNNKKSKSSRRDAIWEEKRRKFLQKQQEQKEIKKGGNSSIDKNSLFSPETPDRKTRETKFNSKRDAVYEKKRQKHLQAVSNENAAVVNKEKLRNIFSEPSTNQEHSQNGSDENENNSVSSRIEETKELDPESKKQQPNRKRLDSSEYESSIPQDEHNDTPPSNNTTEPVAPGNDREKQKSRWIEEFSNRPGFMFSNESPQEKKRKQEQYALELKQQMEEKRDVNHHNRELRSPNKVCPHKRKSVSQKNQNSSPFQGTADSTQKNKIEKGDYYFNDQETFSSKNHHGQRFVGALPWMSNYEDKHHVAEQKKNQQHEYALELEKQQEERRNREKVEKMKTHDPRNDSDFESISSPKKEPGTQHRGFSKEESSPNSANKSPYSQKDSNNSNARKAFHLFDPEAKSQRQVEIEKQQRMREALQQQHEEKLERKRRQEEEERRQEEERERKQAERERKIQEHKEKAEKEFNEKKQREEQLKMKNKSRPNGSNIKYSYEESKNVADSDEADEPSNVNEKQRGNVQKQEDQNSGSNAHAESTKKSIQFDKVHGDPDPVRSSSPEPPLESKRKTIPHVEQSLPGGRQKLVEKSMDGDRMLLFPDDTSEGSSDECVPISINKSDLVPPSEFNDNDISGKIYSRNSYFKFPTDSTSDSLSIASSAEKLNGISEMAERRFKLLENVDASREKSMQNYLNSVDKLKKRKNSMVKRKNISKSSPSTPLNQVKKPQRKTKVLKRSRPKSAME